MSKPSLEVITISAVQVNNAIAILKFVKEETCVVEVKIIKESAFVNILPIQYLKLCSICIARITKD